jgi:multiple sugar transport system permease protein
MVTKEPPLISRRSERTMLALFLGPAVLIVLVFTILPAVWAVYVSFTNRALTGERSVVYEFVGIANYVKLLTNEIFLHSISLTLWYTLWTNIGQFVLGLATALFLNRANLWGKTFLLAAVVLPMVIPAVIQSLIWSSMLAMGEYGTLNRIIGLLGFEPVMWLREAPMVSVTLVNFWNGSGFAMILFLAGLENIPREVIEAAHIDGASAWQTLTRIRLPLIRYVIMLWLLLNTLGCLGVFDLVYTLTRGGPGNSTQLVGIYIYDQSFKFYELGMGSAASVILLCISLIIGLIYVRVLRVTL